MFETLLILGGMCSGFNFGMLFQRWLSQKKIDAFTQRLELSSQHRDATLAKLVEDWERHTGKKFIEEVSGGNVN